MREEELWIQGWRLALKCVGGSWEASEGLMGTMGRWPNAYVGPLATQSACFAYLQENNDMYMWNQVICTKSTMPLLVSFPKRSFVDGFEYVKVW
jgi:hypothetical protein